MSTMTVTGERVSAFATAAVSEDSVIEARLRRAEAHVRPFLARASTADLGTLGFAPSEIEAIRKAADVEDLVKL